ncbi:hypothetical protein U3A55_13125 [Salarchaeum sp. III]|uniref:hypothetical protein n=1 Tax=Salarchaeum sp. III TaxID=3107927 RepID=UPI002ED8DB91
MTDCKGWQFRDRRTMSVAGSDERACLETYEYEHGVARNRLIACPLCGYEFEWNEHRWKHFVDDHGPEDIPVSDT